MTENNFIPITETPYVSKLAKDYLLGKNIGINNPLVKDYNGLLEKAKTKEFNSEKRLILANVLFEQYKKDGVELNENSPVYQNIQSLKEDNTFSFTTGQQIHILLGPLFFIYKIQSLLRHSSNFNSQKNGYKAVPVFWMATEDHDLEEINYVKLYGETYKWEPKAGGAVGRILCKGLPELIDKIEERADKTEENNMLFSLFKKHYTNNKTLAEATRSLLHEIFGKEGLIIIDPDDKILKQSFIRVAAEEIENKVLFHFYNQQNKILKKSGYDSRVNAQEINYFWLEGDKRIKLKIKNSKIVKDDSDEELELYHILQNSNKLSPNVISRPLYQETVLPNILYIGGSAEVEYWLPLQEVFKNAGLQLPALLQRDSGLIISKKNYNIICKARLHWSHLLMEDKELTTHLDGTPNDKSNNLTNLIKVISSNMKELKIELEKQGIKNSMVFKEIKEIQKKFSGLSVQLVDEQIRLMQENPVLNKIFKIKAKYFDIKQERNEFVISYPGVLNNKKIKKTAFEAILMVTII